MPRRLMMLISWLCADRTPDPRSAAAGGERSSDRGFDVMAHAAIGTEAASVSNHTSSGVRYAGA